MERGSRQPRLACALPADSRILIDEGAIQVAHAIIIEPTETSADLAAVKLAAAAMLIARDQGHTTARDVVTLLDSVREKFSKGVRLWLAP
jgi:hypothetical protein